MREIKFSYMYQHDDTGRILIKKFDIHEIELELMGECFIEGYTLIARRQYTGRFDKNGVEIYEGDIVKVENYNHHGKNPKKVMFVYYDNLTAQYCTKIEKTNCKIEDLIMENQPLYFAHSIEIIGNIYENPELLNGEE